MIFPAGEFQGVFLEGAMVPRPHFRSESARCVGRVSVVGAVGTTSIKKSEREKIRKE
jgi:hypothetical protein